MLLSECIRRGGTVAQIEDLVARGAELDVVDNYGQTALMCAISGKQVDIAMSLIECGADVTIPDKEGATALHWAIEHNLRDVAERIARTFPEVVNISDAYGNQPLWTAVFNAKGDYALVRTFIELGADPTHHNKANRSPIALAELKRNAELVEILSTRP